MRNFCKVSVLFVFCMINTAVSMESAHLHMQTKFDDVGEVSLSAGQLDPNIFRSPAYTLNFFEFYTGKYFSVVRESDVYGGEDFTYTFHLDAPKNKVYPCCAQMAYMLLKNKYEEQLKSKK